MSWAVSCRDLAVAYNGSPVLRGIDLEVKTGEWVAIVGPNGSGKSTLLRAIAGLMFGAGSVRVVDRDLAGLTRREAAKLVALVPQNPAIPEGTSVLEYVILGRSPYLSVWAFPSPADRAIALWVLGELDMTNLADRPVASLSGGEFQRAVLGRALAQEAPVLLLDEPTTALDLGHAQEVMELVQRRRRLGSPTVIAAMHDLTLAAQFCDRMVLLAEGELVMQGDARSVVTPENLARHFSADVVVLEGPAGEPVVVPRRAPEKDPGP